MTPKYVDDIIIKAHVRKVGNMLHKVSVFTCVYNGENTIHRVFSSLNKQTYKNIEHIIVNDGSTDDTEELINEYILQAKFPVKYIKKENGGKHTATNIAWDNCTGDFIIQLDADDELLPDAIEFLVNEYEKIPDEQKDSFWCVHGRCIDQINRELVGSLYPDGINEMPVEKAKQIAKNTPGDKVGLMKREKLKDYRYPTPEGVTFVTESHLWFELDILYRTYYTNTPVLVYYLNERNSLSNPIMSSQTLSNHAFNFKHQLENRKRFSLSGKALITKMLFYIIYYNLSTQTYKKAHSYTLKNNDFSLNALLLLLLIPGKAVAAYYRRRWKVT